jgi:hypothetical protein
MTAEDENQKFESYLARDVGIMAVCMPLNEADSCKTIFYDVYMEEVSSKYRYYIEKAINSIILIP